MMGWPVMLNSKASMGPSSRAGAQIIDATVQVELDGEDLQCLGNLVGEVAGDRQLALEKRHAGAQLLEQFLIGKPDEVLEAGGHEGIAVGDLQGEFHALGTELESVGDVAESAGFAQVPGDALEIVFADGLARLQAGGGGDLLRRVALRARDLDGDEFRRRGGLAGLRVWAESREAQASRRAGRVRVTAGILTQEHVGAGVLQRGAARRASSVGPDSDASVIAALQGF